MSSGLKNVSMKRVLRSIESFRSRFRSIAMTRRVGKGALFARRAHLGYGSGGHASLCPPYGTPERYSTRSESILPRNAGKKFAGPGIRIGAENLRGRPL